MSRGLEESPSRQQGVAKTWDRSPQNAPQKEIGGLSCTCYGTTWEETTAMVFGSSRKLHVRATQPGHCPRGRLTLLSLSSTLEAGDNQGGQK